MYMAIHVHAPIQLATYPFPLNVLDRVAEVFEILKLFVYHKSFSISNKVIFICLNKFESFSFDFIRVNILSCCYETCLKFILLS